MNTASGNRWVVGIDSGGSKSIAVLMREDGYIGGLGFGGPTNLLFVSVNDAHTAIRRVVAQALEMAANRGISLTPIADHPSHTTTESNHLPHVQSIYCSSPGLRRHVVIEALQHQITYDSLQLASDAPAAFMGALPGQDGVVVLTGTGSFCYGCRQGQVLLKGGWGPVLGDEGSGYWIAVEALKAMIRQYEQRGPVTILTELIENALHIRFPAELRHLVYGPDGTRHRIAGLAMFVSEAAQAGDAVAQSVLARAGKELASLAIAVAQGLQWQRDDMVVFSVTGGVSQAGESFTTAFLHDVKRAFPVCVWNPPRYAPCVGAALMGLETLAVPVSSAVLERLYSCLQTEFTQLRGSLLPSELQAKGGDANVAI